MRRPACASSLGALLLAAAGIAAAQNAYTSRPMNVRAGPDRQYPLVAQLGPGEPLDVHGCLSDWAWCDVSFDGNRGWIYAGGVSFLYQGERVPLYSYAPRLGLPIITFSLGAYWGQYYRSRPWYSQRETWAHRRFPPHVRPPRRPGGGAVQMPRSRPTPRTHQGRPLVLPSARGPAPRAQEHGHMAPPPRSGARPESAHGPQRRGPPASRGKPNQGQHNEHGKGDRQHRPPLGL